MVILIDRISKLLDLFTLLRTTTRTPASRRISVLSLVLILLLILLLFLLLLENLLYAIICAEYGMSLARWPMWSWVRPFTPQHQVTFMLPPGANDLHLLKLHINSQLLTQRSIVGSPGVHCYIVILVHHGSILGRFKCYYLPASVVTWKDLHLQVSKSCSLAV